MTSGRLELNWTNKDLKLLSHGIDTYEWVQPDDWRITEVRTLNLIETIGEKGSGNLLINGDAAHSLEALIKIPELAKKYKGKIKLCYIDPPFNTGQMFAHYNDAVENSVWLTMFRDRLNQIKELLNKDGSVWVHLDDAQQHRSRMILDEVFGATNWVGTVVWRASDNSNNDSKTISSDHNYIHIYSKEPNWSSNRLTPRSDQIEHYGNSNNDPLGDWFDGNPVNSPTFAESLRYELVTPSGNKIQPPPKGWRWSKTTMAEKISSGEIYFTSDETSIKRKTYLKDHRGLPPSSLWHLLEVTGHNRQAKAELTALFSDIGSVDMFDTPKPEKLMAYIIEIGSNVGEYVLDCFAGSGTTAAVAHKLKRKWITSEVSAETVKSFTRARLEKVILGKDDGGISTKKTYSASEELPSGVSPESVKIALDTIKKLHEASIFQDLLDENTIVQMSKRLRKIGKVKTKEEKIWHGGGGFDLLKVSESIFTENDGLISLNEWAIGGLLAQSVAAQLSYTYEPEGLFVGKKGRSRLAVLDGMLTTGVADFLLSNLSENENLLVVAQTLEPGIDDYLRIKKSGSRAKKIPRDIAKKSALNRKVITLNRGADLGPTLDLDLENNSGGINE